LWVAGLLVVTGIAVALLFWADKLFNGPPPPEVPTFAFRVGRALANGWNRLGVAAVFFTLSTGGLALFYRFGIRHPASVRRRVWPGTIAAMLGWLFVSLLFSAYVRGIGSYAVYYGSLATVATFLIWLYLTSLCFMVGAEVNAILEGVRNEGDEGAPPSVPPFSTRSRSLR
jgi:membrane protein